MPVQTSRSGRKRELRAPGNENILSGGHTFSAGPRSHLTASNSKNFPGEHAPRPP